MVNKELIHNVLLVVAIASAIGWDLTAPKPKFPELMEKAMTKAVVDIAGGQ